MCEWSVYLWKIWVLSVFICFWTSTKVFLSPTNVFECEKIQGEKNFNFKEEREEGEWEREQRSQKTEKPFQPVDYTKFDAKKMFSKYFAPKKLFRCIFFWEGVLKIGVNNVQYQICYQGGN